jgi:hypothetical protein
MRFPIVGHPEAFRHFLQVPQQVVQICGLIVNLLTQGDAIDKFHGDKMQAVRFVDLVNVGNAGMIECSGGLRLADEAIQTIFLQSQLSRQNFQRDLSLEFFRPRPGRLRPFRPRQSVSGFRNGPA